MTLDKFQDAVNRLKETQRDDESEGKYMSDMNNYLTVHVTKYLPRTNERGEMYIPSTAMATDYEYSRNTIHTTMNHAVTPVFGGGDWDAMSYVVLAPFKDVIAINGNPAMVCLVDTYFSVSPDTGLVLPRSAHIVRPAADKLSDGKLFDVRDNETVYKQGDYTPAEIETIMANLSTDQMNKYKLFESGRLSDNDIINEMYTTCELDALGETGKKLYDAAKDKQAFLRGLYENDRDAVLTELVREIATRAAIEKMGYRYLDYTYESSAASEKVAETARGYGMDSTTTNKAHFNSLYHDLEQVMLGMNGALEEIADENMSLDDMAKKLNNAERGINYQIKNALVNDTVPYFYGEFEYVLDCYNSLMESIFSNSGKEYMPHKSISDFDANTDETIRRYCARHEKEFIKIREQLKLRPGYAEFIKKLRDIDLGAMYRGGMEF